MGQCIYTFEKTVNACPFVVVAEIKIQIQRKYIHVKQWIKALLYIHIGMVVMLIVFKCFASVCESESTDNHRHWWSRWM